MTREQIESIGKLLDMEAGAGFTQKALARLHIIQMIADALRELNIAEATTAPQNEEQADG